MFTKKVRKVHSVKYDCRKVLPSTDANLVATGVMGKDAVPSNINESGLYVGGASVH